MCHAASKGSKRQYRQETALARNGRLGPMLRGDAAECPGHHASDRLPDFEERKRRRLILIREPTISPRGQLTLFVTKVRLNAPRIRSKALSSQYV
jgi:hypothetical protein